MAVKKVGGSTKNGRDSIGRRLGIKVNHLQSIHMGSIIIRQRGRKYINGKNTYMSKDHTIHAAINGRVSFTQKAGRVYVNVVNGQS